MRRHDSISSVGINPAFDAKFVNDHATDMVHELGVRCACARDDAIASAIPNRMDTTQRPFCPRCNGYGFLWRDPVVLPGLLSNAIVRAEPAMAGWLTPGDLQFSPAPIPENPVSTSRRPIGEMDKFTATWPTAMDGGGQVILRGAASLLPAPGAGFDIDPLADRLWYEPAEALWCEDEAGQLYTANADFDLGPGKQIRWREGGRAPAVETWYTLKYAGYAEWLAFMPPRERRIGAADMGPLVYLRKRHAYLVQESPFIFPHERMAIAERVS